jgi:hypothetical protein
MTLTEIAKALDLTKRQVLRYCRKPGYKGHVLKAKRTGKSLLVSEANYKAWRIACGFDFLPQPEQAGLAQSAQSAPVVSTPELQEPRSYNPWPMAADPNGIVTNTPHEHSRNWCHPLAMRDWLEDNARKMKEGFYDGQ